MKRLFSLLLAFCFLPVLAGVASGAEESLTDSSTPVTRGQWAQMAADHRAVFRGVYLLRGLHPGHLRGGGRDRHEREFPGKSGAPFLKGLFCYTDVQA